MPYVLDGKINESHGIYFDELGSGVPVVLINGMTRSSRHWMGFEHEMAKHHRVILIDNRGCGKSQNVKRKMGDTIEVMAGDVQNVLDVLGVKRAHFVGLSLGGMISLATCLANQKQAASLTMINSSVGGNKFPRLHPKAVAALVGSLVSRQDVIRTSAAYLVHGISTERREFLIKEWEKISQEENLPFGIIHYQLFAAAVFQARKRLKDIKFPVLIFNARDDGFVPIINSSLLHSQIPGSEYFVTDTGGHEVTVSRPVETAAKISEFIERAEGVEASPTARRKPANKKSNR